jgi:hypothetical protein
VSVQDESVVDIISIREPDSTVVLTISDHLDWSDTVQHQTILQRKLNRYLAFVESGELLERYPAAKGLAVRIVVVFKFKPDKEAQEFLRKAKKVIESLNRLGSALRPACSLSRMTIDWQNIPVTLKTPQ